MKNYFQIARFVLLLLLTAGVALAPPAMGQTAAAGPPTAPMLRVETGGHSSTIWSISVDGEGRYLASASQDKTCRVWDAHTGTLLTILRPPAAPGHEGELDDCAISPDGNSIACGGWTGVEWDKTDSLYIFDRATGRMIHRITGLQDSVHYLSYSSDGRYLAASLAEGGVRLYRTSDYALTGKDTDYAGDSEGCSLHVDASGAVRLCTTCYDGYVRLYKVESDGSLYLLAMEMAPAGKKPYGAAFSPDGSKVAIGYYDAAVSVLSTSDLSLVSSPDASGAKLNTAGFPSVAWSSDGASLYAGGGMENAMGSIVRRWDDQGQGAYTDVAGEENTILDLKSRPSGGVFAAVADKITALDGAGHAIFSLAATMPDYRANQSGFRVTGDGGKVSFGYEEFGKSPAAFSIADRTLTTDQTMAASLRDSLPAPTTSAPGLDIEDWEDTTAPTLNGEALQMVSYERARSVAIAPDQKSFLLGAEWSLYCFDGAGKLIWREPAPDVAWDVSVSGDGKLAIAAFSDGTIRWYRMSDGEPLLAFFPATDKKRWVLWTPSGYYDCSPGGEDLIGWQVNNGPDQAADFFPASRFRSRFYRPDVIQRVLTTLDEAQAVKEANDAAGRTVQTASVVSQEPPVVTIISPESGSSISNDSVTLQYSIRTPSGEPATGVRFLVDGRPLFTEDDLSIVDSSGLAAGRRSATVAVPHEDCIVAVIAQNRFASSEAASVNLKWAGGAKSVPDTEGLDTANGPVGTPSYTIKPKLYILAVGVSVYSYDDLRLVYPAKDAHDFVAAMQAQKGLLYTDVVVDLLTDKDATSDNILDGLDWIERQTTHNDVAMVFLSGHGANDSNGQYMFIPTNFNRDHPKSTTIPFSDIQSTVQNLAGKTLFFVDSCHSGNVMGSAVARDVDVTGAVNALASAENGAIVFAASTGSQMAYEDPVWGNGAFTKALVEGINGKADLMHDGVITANMLDVYISERVKDLTSGRQTPTTTKPQTVPDFPVAVDR